MTTKILSSILVTSCVLIFSTFYIAKAGSRAVAADIVTTPTPTPEKKNMGENQVKQPADAGPISMQASATGVSIPVRELPKSTPAVTQEPREINPQNTIPIKPIKSQTKPKTVPAKRSTKAKSVLGLKTAKKPNR